MGTRSMIGIENPNTKVVKAIYCHWDGYLEHNGAILNEHYASSPKVNNLIALGDLSSLRAEIGEKHAFSQFELRAEEVAGYKLLTEDWCTFYGRDRNENGVSAKQFKSYEDYVANHQYEEYEYILRNVDGKAVWFVADHSDRYVTLAEAFEAEKVEA